MKTHYFASAALIGLASATMASAEPQVTNMAAQDATESTVVNHAEGGSISMQESLSNACPVGDAGQRRQVFTIRFRRPFTDTNYVAIVGLATVDVDHSRNLRLTASIEGKGRDGMTIVATTWCDTNVYSGTFDYVAVGR